MNARARFLVLLGAAPRVLLLDSEQRFVGEVIDEDGYIVRTLLQTAKACQLADNGKLYAMVSAAPSMDLPRCFELD
ncbi:MAG: hypothetical protein ABIP61_02845 [Burkholderiaceae bacterium]